jgi:hypothetical protein
MTADAHQHQAAGDLHIQRDFRTKTSHPQRRPIMKHIHTGLVVFAVSVAGLLLPAARAAQATTPDPRVTWHLDMADIPGSGFDGSSVTIAVIDSGLPQNWRDFLPPQSIDIEHAAAFGSQGWQSCDAPVLANAGEGAIFDLTGHTLANSAILTGFESELGPILGAAPGAKILPIKVFNQFGTGCDTWFAAGIRYVTDLKTSGNLPGPVVIFFSGVIDPSQLVIDAIDDAIAEGLLFVAGTGNDGPDADSITLPGALPQSITVGIVGWVQEASLEPTWIFDDVPESDTTQVYVAGISGRESDPPLSPSLIDVLAPGSVVYTLRPISPGLSEGRSSTYSGVATFPIVGQSIATAHVAGILAQMLQKNPGLTQAEAEAILRATALPIPPDPDGVITAIFVPETPFGPGTTFWGPWGTNATGAGLVRGTAAVAATPLP